MQAAIADACDDRISERGHLSDANYELGGNANLTLPTTNGGRRHAHPRKIDVQTCAIEIQHGLLTTIWFAEFANQLESVGEFFPRDFEFCVHKFLLLGHV